MYVGRTQMVQQLHQALTAAGYGVSKDVISQAYPGKRGAQLLWGVWQHHQAAIHWAAAKLAKKGVIFTKRPPLPPPDPVPLHSCLLRPPRWGADLQLPTGDRD